VDIENSEAGASSEVTSTRWGGIVAKADRRLQRVPYSPAAKLYFLTVPVPERLD
jgi:hypothetical protein